MAIIGYMRVSTHHQKFDSQEKALEKYGVDKLYKEYESGTTIERKQLNKALASLSSGDTFVIFKLDRLARNTKQLLLLMETFEKQNINFISIQNQIDTSTAMGRFFFTVMSAFSEMEAELIRERVKAGLLAAKENGKVLGRPQRTTEIAKALELYQNTTLPIDAIAAECQISESTIYSYARRQNISRKNRTHISTEIS